MYRSFAALALLLASGAGAQSLSYVPDKSHAKDDPNRIVCQTQEKIGTRLGGKKLCLTVAEWQARTEADRNWAEELQAGVGVRCTEQCSNAGLSVGDMASGRPPR